jgi:serine/threonine protein kinase
MLNAEQPSSLQLWLFEQQFELTRSLIHLEGVVKAIALEHYRNTLYMVFEDTGGIAVRQWLSSKPSFVQCLTVAIKVGLLHTSVRVD